MLHYKGVDHFSTKGANIFSWFLSGPVPTQARVDLLRPLPLGSAARLACLSTSWRKAAVEWLQRLQQLRRGREGLAVVVQTVLGSQFGVGGFTHFRTDFSKTDFWPFWGFRCTIHFRTYFSGWIEMAIWRRVKFRTWGPL